MSELLEPLALFVLIVFLVTEILKHVAKVSGYPLGKRSILVAVAIGILLAFGWQLTMLPKPEITGFEYIDILLTGLIIAGIASGLFSWVKDFLPWLKDIDKKNDDD